MEGKDRGREGGRREGQRKNERRERERAGMEKGTEGRRKVTKTNKTSFEYVLHCKSQVEVLFNFK